MIYLDDMSERRAEEAVRRYETRTGWHDTSLSSIGRRYPREPQAGKPLYDERDPVAPGADSDLAFLALGIVLGLGVAALGLATWFALRGGRLWS